VANPGEMACIGAIQDTKVSEDVYIAGVGGEGIATMATTGHILYLNGPGVPSLKVGTVQRVVRAEGRVNDPVSKSLLGVYYKDVGTVRIETVEDGIATARVLLSCQGAIKGDLIVPSSPKPTVEFKDHPSNQLTPIPKGLIGTILMAKDDARTLAAGQFCFIQLGQRDGIKPGDHLIVFRHYPAFNPQDMAVGGTAANLTYASMRTKGYQYKLDSMLFDRSLPSKVLGDIVIVEAGERISTGKIINSIYDMEPGDLVVKK